MSGSAGVQTRHRNANRSRSRASRADSEVVISKSAKKHARRSAKTANLEKQVADLTQRLAASSPPTIPAAAAVLPVPPAAAPTTAALPSAPPAAAAARSSPATPTSAKPRTCWLANLRSGLLGAFEGAKRTLTSVPGQMLLGRLSCLCVWMCVCVGVGKLFLRLNVRWSGLYCLPLGNVSSALRFFGTLVGVRNCFSDRCLPPSV